MKSIYQYPLYVVDEQMVALTENAEPLSIEERDNRPVLFALCDPTMPVRHKKLWLLGTGHECQQPGERKFLGTVKLHGDALIYHAFIEHTPQVADHGMK